MEPPSTEKLVRLHNLEIVARGDDGVEFPIVRDVSLSVAPGEVLALIGESGSGKTTIALSMLGYARPGCRISGGTIEVAGERLDTMNDADLRARRGRTVAYVAQSAAAAFNPALTIMRQVIEPALIHGLMDRPAAEAKARALFAKLALPDPDGVGDRYPHQVSGGQLQRLMAAMALITDPQLVIFDEPTTALDVTTQIEVLKAFKAAVRDLGTTAVYVSHDLAVVAQIADRIVVLRHGAMQEEGDTGRILFAPAHDYSRALVAAAAPRAPATSRTPDPVAGEAPLLDLRDVIAGYGGTDRDGFPRTRILDGVSLTIRRGQVLGVIGESGCGKSTLARVVAGLHPPARGQLTLSGTALAGPIAQRSREELRRVQMVFQMADTALNPATPVGRALARPLTFYHGLRGKPLKAEVARLLDLVKLPAALAERLPGELSGGQKQRVNLARALAARPDLILCDEVTSALDPVVAEAVLDLLIELRRELGLAYMFITHDLETVRAIADDVMVLYAGQTVELATRDSLATAPRHPYARLLMASVPELRQGWLEDVGGLFEGRFAHAGGSTAGCRFYPRCDLGTPGRCDTAAPPLRQYDGREIHCHRTIDELIAATK
ncbi:ABC transporter ATP-binding protein [Sphingomonas solaris]|uniref:Dipeptide ABC transporter ATP-binding protein n=1 Tax=Alterirhizorhabdus solaris TaxID=2529389 RepID=A0A558R185_9SPHN|nr:ABC transporter ATP-binding protein [Sphingomonas solaris]TVV73119.1 dipeptide ABC transporter ATP-binding protein [Sphingomonas solaris]